MPLFTLKPCRASRSVARGAALLATFTSSGALAAAPRCAHPFDAASSPCFELFATVSLVYALIAATYGLGAVLIVKSRLSSAAFKLALLLVPLSSWLGAMLAFSVGGALGWLRYPHDSSPFFFLDWFSAAVTLLITSATVGALIAFGKRPASEER